MRSRSWRDCVESASSGRASTPPIFAVLALGGRRCRSPDLDKEWQQTIQTMPAESREAFNHGGSAELYTGVKADVLLALGSRSPDYYAPTTANLAAAIPQACAIVIPKSATSAARRSPNTSPTSCPEGSPALGHRPTETKNRVTRSGHRRLSCARSAGMSWTPARPASRRKVT
jgi:hypothetical protein